MTDEFWAWVDRWQAAETVEEKLNVYYQLQQEVPKTPNDLLHTAMRMWMRKAGIEVPA